MKNILKLAAVSMVFSTVAFAKASKEDMKNWKTCAAAHSEWKGKDLAKAKKAYLGGDHSMCDTAAAPTAAPSAPAANPGTATTPATPETK